MSSVSSVQNVVQACYVCTFESVSQSLYLLISAVVRCGHWTSLPNACQELENNSEGHKKYSHIVYVWIRKVLCTKSYALDCVLLSEIERHNLNTCVKTILTTISSSIVVFWYRVCLGTWNVWPANEVCGHFNNAGTWFCKEVLRD